MAEFYTASALNWTPHGAEYFNTNRGMLETNTLVLSSQFISSPTLSGIVDISVNHDTLFYLTDKKIANNLFTNREELTAYSLSSLPLSTSTVSVGTSGAPSYVNYNYGPTTPQYNITTDFKNIEYSVPINYLMFSPFRSKYRKYSVDISDPFADELDVFQFNFLNLKNVMTPHYEYDSCNIISKRDYSKIFTGTDQKFGHSNIFLGYSEGSFQMVFKQNDTTYFHYPKDATQEPLSSSCLIARGAKAGDTPMNSDIIAIDQYGYTNGSSGPNPINKNGEFLCAWLSGTNDGSCDSVWLERWYDPDSVTQGTAYIESVNAGCEDIWDVPASFSLIPNVRYYYDRYGKDRNEIAVESISGDIIAHYDVWTDGKLVDSSGNGNNGYIIEDYAGSEVEFELDGSFHAHIPPTDQLLTRRELTVGACVYKDDWCCGKNSQIVGNYHFGGWGIFYNTGMSNNIITVGDDSGNLFSFNIDGTRIFEKDLDATTDINNTSVDYIAVDLDGARWILDSHNNTVYKIDVDDLLVEFIHLPSSQDIYKIQIDPNNRLYIHDRTTAKVFVHDELGTYVETFTAPTTATNFELDTSGNIIFDDGDILGITSDDTLYKVWGSNLYKNGEVIFHFNDRIMDMKIDDEDNVWVVYCGNILVKINSNDEIVFTKKILNFLASEKHSKLGITRKANRNGCDENRIWIVFEDSQTLIEVDTNGKLLTSVNTTELVVSRSCDDYRLRAFGDFTGFDVNRKYDTAGGVKISPDNPALSLRIKLENQCGVKLFKSIHIPVCKLVSGYHHVGMSYSSNSGDLKLFIDGSIAGQTTVDVGHWNIDYNEVTPIIIGGTSGKLGSENTEKSIINNQFFLGKIDDVRIYNKELPEFFVKAIADTKTNPFNDLIWNIPIDNKNYLEKIDRFFMNKKPGHVSKKFNLKINGLDISSDLKLLIEDAINSSITNLIPIHTELNTIVWE